MERGMDSLATYAVYAETFDELTIALHRGDAQLAKLVCQRSRGLEPELRAAAAQAMEDVSRDQPKRSLQLFASDLGDGFGGDENV
jgi:hypothetical protein